MSVVIVCAMVVPCLGLPVLLHTFTDHDSTPHLLCVLKGGHRFFTDLTAAMGEYNTIKKLDKIPYTFDFIRCKSYKGTESTGMCKLFIHGVSSSPQFPCSDNRGF